MFVSYFLTGESRPISSKEGEFDRIVPKSLIGAWEIAARVSNMNLNDPDGVGNSRRQGDQLHPRAQLVHQRELQVDARLHVRRERQERQAGHLRSRRSSTGDKFNIIPTRFALAF